MAEDKARILLDRLFDLEPLTVHKLERIKLELPDDEKYLKGLFNLLFKFPEFTLEKLDRLMESHVLDETWCDQFLLFAIRNRRNVMIYYLKSLKIQYTNNPALVLGAEFSEEVFLLYESHFPVPEDILFRIFNVEPEEHGRQMQFLIDRGYKTNLLCHGETLLTNLISLRTCPSKMYDLVKVIISLGVDVNQPNSRGNTLLHLVYNYHLFDIANLLLENGADPEIQNQQGTTPSAIRDYIQKFTVFESRLTALQDELTELQSQINKFYQSKPWI